MKTNAPEKFNNFGWGLFLIFIGLLWLLPETFPPGSFYFGTGIILFIVAFSKQSSGYKSGWFPIALGVIAIVKGISEYTSVNISIIGILILIGGVSILFSTFKKAN